MSSMPNVATRDTEDPLTLPLDLDARAVAEAHDAALIAVLHAHAEARARFDRTERHIVCAAWRANASIRRIADLTRYDYRPEYPDLPAFPGIARSRVKAILVDAGLAEASTDDGTDADGTHAAGE